MRQCIVCTQEKPDSQFHPEHVFPDAIGGRFMINRVCDECNSKFGEEIDSHLANSWPIRMKRLRHGLHGKGGNLPDLVRNGVMLDGSDQPVVIKTQRTGKHRLRFRYPKAYENDPLMGSVIRGDRNDRKQFRSLVNKVRRESGLPALSSDQIDAATEDMTRTEALAVSVSEEMFVDSQCWQAMAKIAYEMGWYWLGDTYLSDTVAETLRRYISASLSGTWGEEYQVRGQFGIVDRGVPIHPILGLDPALHVAFTTVARGKLRCYVRIFDVFEGYVVLSDHPEVYGGAVGTYIAVDVRSGIVRHSTTKQEWRNAGAMIRYVRKRAGRLVDSIMKKVLQSRASKAREKG